MTSFRILGLAVSAAMLVAIIYGLLEGDFGAEGSAIWALPWGRVSLVDLYLGLALFGAWIAVRERSAPMRVAWWLALVVLGNLAAGLYATLAAFRSRNAYQLLLGSSEDG